MTTYRELGIEVEEGFYCYLKKQEEIQDAVKRSGAVPDFNNPTSTDLLDKYREDTVHWDGAGVYRIYYFAWDPCSKHGLRVEKVSHSKVCAIVGEFQHFWDAWDGLITGEEVRDETSTI